MLLVVSSAAILWLTLAVIPGVSVSGVGSSLLATLIVAAVSAGLRPVLALLATAIGWLGVALAGLVAQAVIFYVALEVTPGITLTGFWPAFWASWLYAALVGVVGWLLDARDDDWFVADMLRASRRATAGQPSDAPGVVIIQIDGLAEPVARWALQAGSLPTIDRWLRSGTHRMVGWRAQLPATTPASQAGILHGSAASVPAFRWFEKETGRLTVTNHPRDAEYVEKQLTDGRGLLADGGVSVGNIFSGDAPKSLLTMSTTPGGDGPSRRFAAAYLRPFGFARSVVLTIGEMVKERYQAHNQRVREIHPRIDRAGSYVALRALTNVVLRDVNVRLLAEQMLAGAPVMYCDFTDYDEVAHHAGPMRSESLASLAGVDRAISALRRIASAAPRPYAFVILSDHGQSQGETFRQRSGQSFAEVVATNAAECRRENGGPAPTTTAADDAFVEEWGPVATFLTAIGRGKGPLARLSRVVSDRRRQRHREQDALGERPGGDVVVTTSGNLGFVYFREIRGRATVEDIASHYPGLIGRLLRQEAIGFIVVRSQVHGVLVIGAAGINYLERNRVEGVDPLQSFGSDAAAEVLRHASLPHVGDLIVNSSLDPGGDVAAFEELVGCHGGLGGWQSDPVLIYPARWNLSEPLVGADAVHRQLVTWLDALGLRRPATQGDEINRAG